jgi:hypothetical protein
MEKSTVELNNGDGDGYGYGSGSGSGSGSGYGYGSGDGYGYGSGDGYGYGSGDGYGYGSGDGYGYGYGYQITIPKRSAWIAYHYIVPIRDSQYRLRNGIPISAGQHIHEDKIKMCECGLHAGLCEQDARNYAPSGSVLTKVKVWGRIQLQKDKLVATDREIIEVLSEVLSRD